MGLVHGTMNSFISAGCYWSLDCGFTQAGPWVCLMGCWSDNFFCVLRGSCTLLHLVLLLGARLQFCNYSFICIGGLELGFLYCLYQSICIYQFWCVHTLNSFHRICIKQKLPWLLVPGIVHYRPHDTQSRQYRPSMWNRNRTATPSYKHSLRSAIKCRDTAGPTSPIVVLTGRHSSCP